MESGRASSPPPRLGAIVHAAADMLAASSRSTSRTRRDAESTAITLRARLMATMVNWASSRLRPGAGKQPPISARSLVTLGGVRLPSGARAMHDAERSLIAAAQTHRVDWNSLTIDGVTLGSAYEALLDWTPTPPDGTDQKPAQARRGARTASGAYYTPTALVEHILDSTLEPCIAEVIAGKTGRRAASAILSLRVCDPACGTGHFLVAACRRLAGHLVRTRASGRATRDADRAARAFRAAMADVVRHCIFGVDLDPIAANLCRVALWLAVDDPGLSLEACGTVRVGNAILGVPPDSTIQSRAAADAWCAEAMIESGSRNRRTITRSQARRIAIQHRFLHWHLEFPTVFTAQAAAARGFDVVVGNPPFLGQLRTDTASSRDAARLLAARYHDRVRGYADVAATFLLLGTQLIRPGGRVCLVQPQSLLATRDASRVRNGVLEHASLESLWVANARVFRGAAVFTCAPTLRRSGARDAVVSRTTGADFTSLAPLHVDMNALAQAPTWGEVAAPPSDVPDVIVRGGRTLGDIAHATADFRDQYYGLQGFLVEHDKLTPTQRQDAAAFPRLITSGLIDLAQILWGDTPTRVHKRVWMRPRVDRARLEHAGELGPWMRQRLVPKVLVATQTRVIEVIVDATGELLPSTPVITVTPHHVDRLWHVAAALASPVVSAFALRHYGSAALSADAIKLSASQIRQLPIPAETPTTMRLWDRAAEHLKAAHDRAEHAARIEALMAAGRAMTEASGVGDAAALVRGWAARLALPSHAKRKTPR
ncbi:MAG: N-6 DNA methylase [Planctomycetota bacterium]|nr:N-6 DNA methylase [Planctomycetota bacterium]